MQAGTALRTRLNLVANNGVHAARSGIGGASGKATRARGTAANATPPRLSNIGGGQRNHDHRHHLRGMFSRCTPTRPPPPVGAQRRGLVGSSASVRSSSNTLLPLVSSRPPKPRIYSRCQSGANGRRPSVPLCSQHQHQQHCRSRSLCTSKNTPPPPPRPQPSTTSASSKPEVGGNKPPPFNPVKRGDGVGDGRVPPLSGVEVARGGTGGAVGGAGAGAGGGGLPYQVSELYGDLERKLMATVHTQDKKRFRVGGTIALAMLWMFSVFGSDIQKLFARGTADLAKETLKVEALQVQTQELATALVQTLLNDQEVVRAGAVFLREASGDPETQAALVSLALYVLQHPETLGETIVLGKKLVQSILDDPDTVQQVTDMSLKVMSDARFQKGAADLVVAVGQSDEVYGAVTELASRVIQDPKVRETLSAMLSASSHKVLEDQEVLDHSKEFVAQVVGDDAVQRSGGDALWNTVQYALSTRVMKAVGLTLLVATSVVLSGLAGGGTGYSGGWGRGAWGGGGEGRGEGN